MYSNISISAYGMLSNALRMRIISENIANANTTSMIPGGQPYRRKITLFRNRYHEQENATLVRVAGVAYDKSPFKITYNPNHPAANKKGYVLRPNVDITIEHADMREAMYTYNANMAALKISRSMFDQALSILQ